MTSDAYPIFFQWLGQILILKCIFTTLIKGKDYSFMLLRVYFIWAKENSKQIATLTGKSSLSNWYSSSISLIQIPALAYYHITQI